MAKRTSKGSSKPGKSRRVANPGRHAGKNAKGKLKGNVVDLKAARDKKKSNVPYGEPSDETVLMHMKFIDEAALKVEKLKEEFDKAKGALRQRYASAKEARIDIDALKDARKESDEPVNEAVAHMRHKARYLRLMDAPIAAEQLGLFPWLDIKTEAKAEPYMEGQAAGKNAQPRDENPYPPGSDAWSLWMAGHQVGQDDLQENLTKKDAAPAAEAASAEAAGA